MTVKEDHTPDRAPESVPVRTRPLVLTLLCLISFVYFGLLSLLFMAGLFNSAWITSVTNQYLSPADLTKVQTLFFFGAGFILHGFGFTGVLLIWNLRRKGYYFLGISCLLIATYQLLNPLTAISSTATYIILLLLFGLFFKRFH
jgi:hypothetical protein